MRGSLDKSMEEKMSSVQEPSVGKAAASSSRKSSAEAKGHPRIIYMIATCATIGGLLFGYDTGIINGALIIIGEDFELTSFWAESIVTATVASAAVFSIISGTIADLIGRKPTIMIAAVVFTFGGFCMGVAPNLVILFLGRAIVGAAIGVVSCIVPVYVSECAPKDIRGCLITLNQLFITLGIVLSAILAGMFQNVNEGWRWMLGLAAVPGIVQFVSFFFLPESPRYLVMKGRNQEAEEILKRIRQSDNIYEELNEIISSVEADKDNQGLRVWQMIMSTPHVKRALFIGCMLQLFQQCCGINTVIYYSATILKSAGFSDKYAIWLSTIPFSINFLATFIGLWAVEKLGRKLVLAVSFFAIAGACAVLSVGFVLASKTSPPTDSYYDPKGSFGECAYHTSCFSCLRLTKADCGYCALNKDEYREDGACVLTHKLDDTFYAVNGRCAKNSSSPADYHLMESFCPNKHPFVPLFGLVFFVLAFAPGAGPMPWTINAEIYPLWARSVANSVATLSNWVFNAIVSFSFMSLLRMIQAYGTFLVFMMVSILAAIFVLMMVPETKGLSLEEIECLFMTDRARSLFLKNRTKQTDNKAKI